MSPSEDDLRAALRAGEHDARPPAADAIIARAEQVRRTRRVRVAQLAAAVVVMGLIGVGTVALGGGSGRSGDTTAAGSAGGSANRSAASADTRYAAGAAAGSASTGSASTGAADAPRAASLPCPSTVPSLALPGGGGTGRFGADEPVYAVTPARIVACAYASGRATGWATLVGRDAADVAASLNAAPVWKPLPCPAPLRVTTHLVLLASGPDGTALPVVVAELACPYLTTNGTAARAWTSLPGEVRALISAAPTAGRVSGSPAR